MRLTLDLLRQCPESINAANQRQLDLRGLHLELLENLGMTEDAFECLDFSDNGLVRVFEGGDSSSSSSAGIAKLKRLKSLILANNAIQRIGGGEGVGDALPSLESLILTKNRLKTLTDLLPLQHLRSLKYLVLRENEVCHMDYYREFVIYIMRNSDLRVLDFEKVTEKEKTNALQLFESQQPDLLERIAPPRIASSLKDAANANGTNRAKSASLPPEQQRKYAELIQNADTQQEIDGLRERWERGEAPPEDGEMGDSSGALADSSNAADSSGMEVD